MKSLTAIVGMFLCGVALAQESPRRPNVILVMSDDQGYGDLGCHGNPIVRTPHLDRLHGQSVRFTDFHVAPMCTPTRGQLLTGVDALRNGAMNVSSGRTLLRREFPTIADMLRNAGYATGIFGKWHLGDNYPFRPIDRGFDEAVWFPSSHIGAVPDAWMNDYFDDTYFHRAARMACRGYTTDVFFDEAIRWASAQRKAGKPFFLYLPTAAPHGPLYVAKKYRDAVQPRLEAVLNKLPKLNAAEQGRLVRFLAMIENLDENMGRLMAFLKDNELEENTILIFLTDNGSTMGPRYFNAGMKGGKVTLWEGGHRVPLFVRWPGGKLGDARDVKELVQVQDIAPTLLELCGAKAPEKAKFDGISLAPLLKGLARELPERMLVVNYSRMPLPGNEEAVVPKKEGAAVLWRKWRWLENKSLYDLSADPLQNRDVSAQHPEFAGKMRKHLDQWWEGVRPRVNEPQRVIVGSPHENPTRLTACEWWDVFVDQQAQVRRGEKKNGNWHIEVAEDGDYEIALRRWPEEAKLALAAPAPAAMVTDGSLPAGPALPIARASIAIQGMNESRAVSPSDMAAVFRLKLKRGTAELRTTFADAEGKEICGAYYVTIHKR